MRQDPSQILTGAVERLSMALTLEDITGVVAETARKLTGADGATFVLRDEDKCYYADENAISPLWKGKRFPLEACISGWSMLNKKVVVIGDIYNDARIPHDAYRPTFVKSLCMVPIRAEDPAGAIGNYWASGYCPSEEDIRLLQILANSSAVALENLELKQKVLKRSLQLSESVDHQRELETALHTMAHDLRNPLSTMMLVAELLKSRVEKTVAGEDPRLVNYINSILSTGNRVNAQIQRMLSLYSTTRRKIELQKVNLSDVAREISNDLRMQAPARQVEFEIGNDLTAYADPQLIRLALDNLMSNAFKYTSKKAEAAIKFDRASESSNTVTFFIRDNGAGFDPADQSKLFRPLVRLHEASEFPGVGLGLASVARIIELHGGKIRAEGHKSQGATFYFDLPLTREAAGF